MGRDEEGQGGGQPLDAGKGVRPGVGRAPELLAGVASGTFHRLAVLLQVAHPLGTVVEVQVDRRIRFEDPDPRHLQDTADPAGRHIPGKAAGKERVVDRSELPCTRRSHGQGGVGTGPVERVSAEHKHRISVIIPIGYGILEVTVPGVAPLQQRSNGGRIDPLDRRGTDAIDAPHSGSGFLKLLVPLRIGQPGLFRRYEQLHACSGGQQPAALDREHLFPAVAQVALGKGEDLLEGLSPILRTKDRQFRSPCSRRKPGPGVPRVPVATADVETAPGAFHHVARSKPEARAVFQWPDRDFCLVLIDQCFGQVFEGLFHYARQGSQHLPHFQFVPVVLSQIKGCRILF